MPAFDRARSLATAEKFVKAGKMAEAVAEYKKLADDNPRDMNVVNKLGDLLVRAGKVPDALKQFLRIADFYARDGFFLKAIAMYKKICKIDPKNLECQQKLAELYQQQGLTTEAKTQFIQVAEALMRQGQGPEAADALRKVLEVDPENHKVRNTLAELLSRSAKPEDAAREYCNVARLAAARGALDETIQLVRKAVKAAPAGTEVASVLLTAIVKVEAIPADALAVAAEIATNAVRSALAQVVHSEALRRAGRHEEAATGFQRVAEGSGLDDDLTPEALIIVARFHAGRDGSSNAWTSLERLVARLLVESRVAEAGGFVDEFLKRNPTHRQALGTRAEIAGKEENPAAEGTILMRLARVLIDASELDRAREILPRLTSLRPGDVVVQGLRDEIEHPGSAGAAPPPAVAAAPPVTTPPRVAPSPVVATAPVIGDAEEERESADQIFSLEDDTLVVEEEPDAAPADLGASGDAEDAAYGPDSRIQDIQAAEPGGEPVDEDFVSEHLTEADVFVKYGLQDKAREQLRAVLDRYPQHEATRQKLKEIFLSEGNTDAAVRECLALADQRRAQGREADAREIVNEALRIDPESPLLKGIAEGVAAAAPAPPVPARPATSGKDRSPSPAKPAAKPAPVRAASPQARPAGPAPLTISDESLSLGDDEEIEIEMEDDSISVTEEVGSAEPDFAATTARTQVPLVAERIEEEAPEEIPKAAATAPDPFEDDLFRLDEPEVDTEQKPEPVPDRRRKKTATPPARAAAEPDDEKLGEVDFYIEQGLIDEARQVLFQLRKQHPESKSVKERLARLDRPEPSAPAKPPKGKKAPEAAPEDVDFEVEQALTGKSRPAEQARPAPHASRPRPVFRVEKQEPAAGGDFFDLAAELDASLAEEQEREHVRDKDALDGQAHSFEDIFEAFKKGVAQQVDSDDFDTHYNLGIAYKEMGLVDEAIGELQFAARDPSRTLECCGILGLCFRDKGLPDLALKWYRRGLDHPGLDEQQTVGLRYDMAEVLKEKGELDQALGLYTEVYGVDSTYRDVSARIKELKALVTASRR
ncbi:MAG TPA: tetratricopeptide repeat protein [Patescibacteria group bacterium]|nr:tetratricopeptide repeat protein [Patescibacteria group bacterium]